MTRLFYAIYLGVAFSLLALQLARLIFSSEKMALKLPRFLNGLLYLVIWPVAFLAPVPRRHIGALFQFAFGRKSKDLIDITPKERKDDQHD